LLVLTDGLDEIDVINGIGEIEPVIVFSAPWQVGRSDSRSRKFLGRAQFERDIASGAKARGALRPILCGLKPVPFKLIHCQFL
jgi:hypothetical protein